MKKINIFVTTVLFLLILGGINLFAQTENKQLPDDTNYEVILQVVIGSNSQNGKNVMPENLNNAVKKLKTFYNFSNFNVKTTFIQRTTNNFEYKGLQSDFIKTETDENPVFSEWNLRGLRKSDSRSAQKTLMFDSFRFGVRFPLMVEAVQENGSLVKKNSYEYIGVQTSKFSLNQNEPTLIGSLTTPNADEMVFLIMTVQPI